MDTGERHLRWLTAKLDTEPVSWLVGKMDYIGIFEAKTRFPGLCDQVVRSGIPVTVQRRGQPLVLISPAAEEASAGERGILDAWNAWSREHAEKDDSDFPEVWKFREDLRHHPLED